MTKVEYLERHGLTLREVTPEDRVCARTDYQRASDYIISNGTVEWFSKGRMRDMQEFVRWHKKS